jgi:hypothetical protein
VKTSNERVSKIAVMKTKRVIMTFSEMNFRRVQVDDQFEGDLDGVGAFYYLDYAVWGVRVDVLMFSHNERSWWGCIIWSTSLSIYRSTPYNTMSGFCTKSSVSLHPHECLAWKRVLFLISVFHWRFDKLTPLYPFDQSHTFTRKAPNLSHLCTIAWHIRIAIHD